MDLSSNIRNPSFISEDRDPIVGGQPIGSDGGASSSARLCKRCLNADFTKIFRPHNTGITISGNNFGSLQIRRTTSLNVKLIAVKVDDMGEVTGGSWTFASCLRETRCSFCQFLIHIMRRLYHLEGGRDYITTTNGNLHLVNVEFSPFQDGLGDGIGKEIGVTFHNTTGGTSSPPSELVEPYLIQPLQLSSSPGEGNAGYAREIPDKLNIKLLLEWKKLCTTKHRDGCEKLEITQPLKAIRLINVNKECLELFPNGSDPQYAAISYPWGKIMTPTDTPPSLSKDTLEAWSSCRALSENPLPKTDRRLPRTILDAIKVTKGLGIPYLWVDSLCIVQDSEEFNQQIDQMHVIYHRATVTIIAAAGRDCKAGLTGISRPRPDATSQLKADVISCQVAATPKFAFSSLLASYWMSRGWTLQEDFFSRRKIYFLEDIVIFKCSKAHWREDVIWESNENSGFFVEGSPEYSIGSLMTLVKHTNITKAFEGILNDYLCRSFTKPEDILRGFTGIIHFMAETCGMGQFFYGLPKRDFYNSICWDHRNKGYTKTRRNGFPSWSWAGWLWTDCSNGSGSIRPEIRCLSPRVGLRPILQFWALHDSKHDYGFTRPEIGCLHSVHANILDQSRGWNILDHLRFWVQEQAMGPANIYYQHDHFVSPCLDEINSYIKKHDLDVPEYSIAFSTSYSILPVVKEDSTPNGKYLGDFAG